MASAYEFYIGMADYQFRPNMEDPVVKLRLAMDNMNGQHFPGTIFRLLFNVCICSGWDPQLPYPSGKGGLHDT